MGAPRRFVIADLGSLGTADREEMNVIEEHTMQHGDLYVLWPEMNKNYSHGVPKDPSAKELRVSLVLRHVTKHWIRRLAADPNAPWEICMCNAEGR